jgi:hypothetical protein
MVNRKQRRAQAANSRSNPRILYQSDDIDPAISQALKEHSAAIDMVSDDDKKWFAANPDRNYRLRRSAAAEIAFHECSGVNEPSGRNAYTLVKQIVPGSRLRMPFRTHAIYRPEHYGENACAALFAELEEQYPTIAQAIKSSVAIARRGAGS